MRLSKAQLLGQPVRAVGYESQGKQGSGWHGAEGRQEKKRKQRKLNRAKGWAEVQGYQHHFFGLPLGGAGLENQLANSRIWNCVDMGENREAKRVQRACGSWPGLCGKCFLKTANKNK